MLNPYTYTGRRLDDETGLHYFRARYHDAVLGRFLERDPLGYPDGLNSHAAYHVMYGGVDPMGMKVHPAGQGLSEVKIDMSDGNEGGCLRNEELRVSGEIQNQGTTIQLTWELEFDHWYSESAESNIYNEICGCCPDGSVPTLKFKQYLNRSPGVWQYDDPDVGNLNVQLPGRSGLDNTLGLLAGDPDQIEWRSTGEGVQSVERGVGSTNYILADSPTVSMPLRNGRRVDPRRMVAGAQSLKFKIEAYTDCEGHELEKIDSWDFTFYVGFRSANIRDRDRRRGWEVLGITGEEDVRRYDGIIETGIENSQKRDGYTER